MVSSKLVRFSDVHEALMEQNMTRLSFVMQVARHLEVLQQ